VGPATPDTSEEAAVKLVRALVAATAIGLVASPQVAPAAPSLAHLQGVAELKSWFNSNRGHPRLLLLLSPT